MQRSKFRHDEAAGITGSSRISRIHRREGAGQKQPPLALQCLQAREMRGAGSQPFAQAVWGIIRHDGIPHHGHLQKFTEAALAALQMTSKWSFTFCKFRLFGHLHLAIIGLIEFLKEPI